MIESSACMHHQWVWLVELRKGPENGYAEGIRREAEQSDAVGFVPRVRGLCSGDLL